jgi:hypothetical protein
VEQKDKTPKLFKTLVISDYELLQFYLTTGLLSINPNKKGKPAIQVNHEKWGLLITEYKL